MEDTESVATLLESTTSKMQQLQKAFAELESYRAVTLNLKWKQIEDHFHGLEKSLKRRFTQLEDQEKEFKSKTVQSQQVLETRQAAVLAKEEASLEKLQENRDAAVTAITHTINKHKNDINNLTENDLKLLSKSNPELVKPCEKMDFVGLHKFISDNRKNLASIKEEIPIALKAAADPGRLVLDALGGFYIENGKIDSNLLGVRRTCIMLMECLSILLTNLDVNTVITNDVKEQAKVIAENWKFKLHDLDADASNGNSLEAHAFLQLVATFGIDSDFVQEDLSKLIPMVSRRRQTADLCRFLGLSPKMPGVIDVLLNSGRHIDAVNLACAFELTEQFSPVSLLKSYLTDASWCCSPTTQNDTSERELSALIAVIKCIEDHKLEEHFPSAPLQKQILQLEKAKADKKRAREVLKPQHKRPRANGVAGYAPHNPNIAADKNLYPRITDRYAPPTQYVYDNRPYGYHVQPDNHMQLFMGSATYNMAPNHGNYYQYQAHYIH